MADAPGNGALLGHLPMAARVIALVGIPGVIAIFMVWTTSRTLPAIAQDVLLNRLATERAQAAQEQAVRKQEELLRMMQRICVSVAKDEESRSRCFDR